MSNDDLMNHVLENCFKKLVDENRVREEVVSIKDCDDVLVTVLDTKYTDNFIVNNMKFALIVFCAMDSEERRKYGMSMLSDVEYTREYHATQVNFFNVLSYSHDRIDKDEATIKYYISKEGDFVKCIEFFDVEYNNPDSIVRTKFIIRNEFGSTIVVWEGEHKISDRIIINDRFTCLINPCVDLFFEVSIPNDEAQYLLNANNRVEYMYVSDKMRRMLVNDGIYQI